MSIRLTLDADLFPNRHRLDTHIVWAHNRLPNEMSQNMFGWSCSLPLYAATPWMSFVHEHCSIYR